MKLSQFSIFMPWSDKSDKSNNDKKYLVANTWNQALITVDKELKAVLENLDKPIPSEAEEPLRVLYQMGVVVDDDLDESALVKTQYDKLRFDHAFFRSVILTTYQCNFGCEYCYEDGVKENLKMDEKTAQTAAEWLTYRIDFRQPKEVGITYLGGEPLLHPKPITLISERLYDHCQERGIKFSFNITTNGAMLTEEMVDRWLPIGLSYLKVTLDGDREIHNKKRPFLGGQPTFDRILDRIELVVDKAPIIVSVNLDMENADRVSGLLDEIEVRGLKERILEIKFGPIIDTKQPLNSNSGSGLLQISGLSSTSSPISNFESHRLAAASKLISGCVGPSDPAFHVKMVEAHREALKRGFRAQDRPSHVLCAVHQDNNLIVIDPIGRLYSCPTFVGRDSFDIGSIFKESLNQLAKEFVNQETLPDCLHCAYFPVCGSGCRYGAQVKLGDWRHVLCEKENLSVNTAEMFKLRAERMFSVAKS